MLQHAIWVGPLVVIAVIALQKVVSFPRRGDDLQMSEEWLGSGRWDALKEQGQKGEVL